jgi:hypothetical protein
MGKDLIRMTGVGVQSPDLCADTEEKRENPRLDNLFPGRGSRQVPAELKSRAGISTLFYFFKGPQTLLSVVLGPHVKDSE